jgi:hypothetical protein
MADDRYQEILEGVSPGDLVVVQGNYQLQYVAPAAPAADAHTKGPAEAGEKGIGVQGARVQAKERERSGTGWILAGLVLLGAVGGLWLLHRFRKPGATPVTGR